MAMMHPLRFTAAEMRDSAASSADNHAAIAREYRQRADRADGCDAAIYHARAERAERNAKHSRTRAHEWAAAALRERAG